MKQQRPVYLNLLQIKQPLPAIISILHRISGVLLFLLLPLLLWLLGQSLASESSFSNFKELFANPVLRFFIWVALSALIYHLVAGIRHLLMDLGLGESLKSGRISAKLTLLISVVFIILLGICLW